MLQILVLGLPPSCLSRLGDYPKLHGADLAIVQGCSPVAWADLGASSRPVRWHGQRRIMRSAWMTCLVLLARLSAVVLCLENRDAGGVPRA